MENTGAKHKIGIQIIDQDQALDVEFNFPTRTNSGMSFAPATGVMSPTSQKQIDYESFKKENGIQSPNLDGDSSVIEINKDTVNALRKIIEEEGECSPGLPK